MIRFDEQKTTQAAAHILKLSGGELEYMKLVKLLYNSDREALLRWSAPITFDVPTAMPHGMVPSLTLDLAEAQQPKETYWGKHIEKIGKWNDKLINDPGRSRLSNMEIAVIEEIDTKYKDWNGYQMGQEHHRPEKFPEYVDPKGSSINIGYKGILQKAGIDKEDIETILTAIEGKAILDLLA